MAPMTDVELETFKTREAVIELAVGAVERYVRFNTGIYRFLPKSTRQWTERHLAEAFSQILKAQ